MSSTWLDLEIPEVLKDYLLDVKCDLYVLTIYTACILGLQHFIQYGRYFEKVLCVQIIQIIKGSIEAANFLLTAMFKS